MVLASEPSNCKALFRRAECFKQLAQYDKCESNLRSLLKIDPSNKQARALAEKVAALTDAIEATTTTVTNTTTATSNSCADTKKAVAEIPLELTVAETRSAVLRCLEQGRSSDAVALCSKTIADVQTASNELFSSVTQKEELLLSLQILQITSLYASGDYSGGVIVCDQILSIYPKHFRATLKKAEGQAKLVSLVQYDDDIYNYSIIIVSIIIVYIYYN